MESSLPFIDFIKEDKSKYPKASETVNPKTGKAYIDPHDDFLVGDSGGFLMNWSFKFIDTSIFSEVAQEYEKNIRDPEIVSWVNSLDIPSTENRGKFFYCPFPTGSLQYDNFWKRETDRRRRGMTAKCKLLSTGEIVDLHITGDHYNYLNYGRIMRTPTEQERQELDERGLYKQELIEGFPRFWDGDYWNFKIDEFIARNKFHLTKGKARGKGYSNKRGSQGANTMNLIPSAVIVLAAYNIDYLTDPKATTDMLKTNLDWFEEHTHWKRFYLSENYEHIQLGYRLTAKGHKKFGYLSTALSVALHNNPSAAIGKRAIEIDVEEAGKCPNLDQFMDVTMSSTEVGAGKVGTIRVYGTSGVKDADYAMFGYVFYNPKMYDMFPMENVWDEDSRHTVCGFFHPQVLNMEPFMDEHGNSLFEKAYQYDIKDKKEKENELSPEKYFYYVAQRANKPSEAFSRGVRNIFSSPELTMHTDSLLYGKQVEYHRDGMWVESADGVIFKTNAELKAEGSEWHPYIMDVPFDPKKDFYGCVREYHPPYKIDGVVPKDLYYIVYDTVGIDKKSDLVIAKNSLNSIQVWMYPNTIANSTGDIMVAAYAGRPEKMQTANRIAFNLCRAYNAKALVEVNRGTCVQDFRRWNGLHYLMRDPTVALFSRKDINDLNVPYGMVIEGTDKAELALQYLQELLYTQVSKTEDGKTLFLLHYIKDIPFLLELTTFRNIGNFDRISAARLVPFARKVYLEKKTKSKATNTTRSIKRVIGLYGHT